ncbi:MAG TPA: hypothetical protein DEP72_07830 [Clostridiales bacterium]|nr:hypothetical protein [Clostridiales bacterium]
MENAMKEFEGSLIPGHEGIGTEYFIRVPGDYYLKPIIAPSIVAARRDEKTGGLCAIGPEDLWGYTRNIDKEHYINIIGNFEQIPKGAVLFYSDWAKILSKVPNLPELIKEKDTNFDLRHLTTESATETVTIGLEDFARGTYDNEDYIGKDARVKLSQETLNSIEPVEQVIDMND